MVPGIISLYFPSFTMRLSPKCMENRTSFSMLGFYFKKGPQSWISTQDIPQDPICVGDAETEQTYLGEKIEGHWQADLWAFSSLVKDRGERGSLSHKRQTLSIEDHKSSVQTSAAPSPLCWSKAHSGEDKCSVIHFTWRLDFPQKSCTTALVWLLTQCRSLFPKLQNAHSPAGH